MLDEKTIEKLKEKFEKEGEEKVATDLATGVYGNRGNPHYPEASYAETWLTQKKSQREEFTKEKEIALNEEGNEIAIESNKIAKSAKRSAWWAIVVSIISIILSFIALSSGRTPVR